VGTSLVIEAVGLEKSFGHTHALGGLDLEAESGTILGVLGPNGSGKTTAVRVLTTLLRPDRGMARVGGYDVVTRAPQVRRHIGLAGQSAALDESLTGSGNLVMIGQLCRLPRHRAQQRAEELLSRFDLAGAADRGVKTYSGGMRRRLDLAASLVSRPSILFLDEPTTGLDPRSRLVLWDIIRTLVADGTTVLLTTQYLEEADRLADLVYVLDRGQMVASGTPASLKARTGAQLVVARFEPPGLARTAGRALAEQMPMNSDDPQVDQDAGLLTMVARHGIGSLLETARILAAKDIAVTDLGLRQPSLDETFLALTGPGTRKAPAS
jgi:daunorubicin resistance ABC transporter ATP-binding subunit